MKKDDLIQVQIEDIGSDGQGIGKVDGMTIFVKDAITGDLVEARIMKMKNRMVAGATQRKTNHLRLLSDLIGSNRSFLYNVQLQKSGGGKNRPRWAGFAAGIAAITR